MSARLRACTFAAVFGWSALASAQSSLDWSAPPECDQRDELNQLVVDLTGHSLEEQVVPANFSIVIERSQESAADAPDGWVLLLTVEREGQTLTRRIQGEDCTSVTRAAASALALILSPSPDETPASTEPAPAAKPAESAPPEPEAKPSEPPQKPTESRVEPATPGRTDSSADDDAGSSESFRWGARVSGGIDATLFPGVVGLVQGAAFASRAGFRFEALGALLPNREFTFTSGTVGMSLATGGLRACRDASTKELMFLPCLDFEVGRLSAVGDSTTSGPSALWLAAGGTFLGGYRLGGNYALFVEVPVRFPLERHRVRLGGDTVVHELPWLDLRMLFGLEATWP